MSEMQPSEYTRVNEIDRAHAVAGFINRTLYSDESIAARNALQAAQEIVLGFGPIEQANDTLARKNAEEETTLEFAHDLEEVYNWNPSKSLTMSAAEFDALARGFEVLKQRRVELESTYKTVNGIYNHFYKTEQLSGYVDQDSREWDLDAVKNEVKDLLWGGIFVYCTLHTAESPYEEFVYMNSMKTWDDETYDYDKHYDEYRQIENKKEDVSEWFSRGYREAKTEYLVADCMLNQYIFEHAEPTSKAHKDAKDKLRVHRDYYKTKDTWDEYSSEVREFYEANDIPLEASDLFVWWVSDEALDAPDVEPVIAERVFTDEQVSSMSNLVDKLDDFRDRSLDAAVAARLIREGKADEVVDNFHVFAGDTSQAALELLNQKGVEYTLGSLSRLHSLDNTFLSTLLEEWDKAWKIALREGAYEDDYRWPMGLYYPTDKMGHIVHNLGSFGEGALSAGMPFELVERMGADRDHGGDSIHLVQKLMENVDRFEPFDHLELAKHYAREVRVPHYWSWHEMLEPVIDALDLPDTPESQQFMREVEEVMRNNNADDYEDSEV